MKPQASSAASLVSPGSIVVDGSPALVSTVVANVAPLASLLGAESAEPVVLESSDGITVAGPQAAMNSEKVIGARVIVRLTQEASSLRRYPHRTGAPRPRRRRGCTRRPRASTRT